jgi:hypothetical protein
VASVSLSDLTPDTRERALHLLALAANDGLEVEIVSTLRSCDDQGVLPNLPVIIVAGVPIARASGCRSWHVWGRAIDLVPKDPARTAELGLLGEAAGFTWGGRFKSNPDPMHFEWSGGYDIQKLCPEPERCTQSLANFGIPGRVDHASLMLPQLGMGAKVAVAIAGGFAGFHLARLLWRFM